MPLYDVTHKDVLVKPKDAENYDVLQGALKALNAKRFAKDVRIIDEALQQAVDRATSKDKLVFTKTGILVGHHSVAPTTHTTHIWDSAAIAYPMKPVTSQVIKTVNKINPQLAAAMAHPNHADLAGELQLKFVGGLVRWRISLREEMWLVYRRESDRENRFTGKVIRVSEYWVNNDYVPPMTHIKHTVSDLMKKFNRPDIRFVREQEANNH